MSTDLKLSQDEAASRVRSMLARSIEVKTRVMETQSEQIVNLAMACSDAIAGGGKLMLCGNGGSAADAQHLAAEFLVRLRPRVSRRPIAAISLALDPSSLTACGNDFHYENYFERMVMGLGKAGDILIGISTSGNSANIVKAMTAARDMGITTVGLLGCGGGKILPVCDHALVVPSDETARIQESHIAIGHAMFELIEDDLLARNFITLE